MVAGSNPRNDNVCNFFRQRGRCERERKAPLRKYVKRKKGRKAEHIERGTQREKERERERERLNVKD